MDPNRRTALITGLFFVGTFVSSIVGLLLYGPLLDHTDYVLGAGEDKRIALGAFCELILIVTNVGTAVTLFPILKKQSESVALGYVTSRVIESCIIVVGIISLLSVVTLRQDLAGASGSDATSLVAIGRSLVAIHDWTFLLGPAFCAGFGNGLLLGYLMFQSRLVPRSMSIFGLVGGPLLVASATGVLFGFYDQTSAVSFITTIPEILWEGSLGLWLIFKGFSASPLTVTESKDPTLPRSTARPPIVAAAAPQLP